jgi:flavodoxin
VNALVVYDSQYGNTEKIARAIGKGLNPDHPVEAVPAAELAPDAVKDLEILVVGSPTQKFSPTAGISDWLGSLPPRSLSGIRAAAFDTRFTEEKIQENKVLAFFVRLFGYAARPIARALARKGARTVLPPEGFYVGGLEGPLLEDELDRARQWGRQLLQQAREEEEEQHS